MKRTIAGTSEFSAQLVGESHSKTAYWTLPDECPIALCFNEETYAVMLATPFDLTAFARGFCHSEGLVKNDAAILSISEKQVKDGFEVNINITEEAYDRIQIIDKRRRLAGASGCGICGLTSLSHISENLPKITSSLRLSTDKALSAVSNLRNFTPLNTASHSVHAAAFANEAGEIIMAKEDVGRHNALDKLFGALLENKIDLQTGFIILSSRFAYELAQKCIRMKVPIVISISAPTSMAVDMAKQANLTYAAVAENENLMVFSAQQRLLS